MTVGSTFAGIEGLGLGFEWAGFDIAWQVEKDPFCLNYLKKNWPHVPKIEDIHDAGKHNLAAVDVICGGFPCQPFSLAGKRGGSEDDRYLWPELCRLVDELGPRWFVGENVPGILSMEQPARLPGMEYESTENIYFEKIAGRIIGDLQQIGYELPTGIDGTPILFSVPAAGVDAHHIRQRIIFVAHATSERFREKGPLGTGYTQRPFCAGAAPDSVANANNQRRKKLHDSPLSSRAGLHTGTHSGPDVPHAPSKQVGRAGFTRQSTREPARWDPEPAVGRLANGIPNRNHWLRALGNAVVPQVAYEIAMAIREVEMTMDSTNLRFN